VPAVKRYRRATVSEPPRRVKSHVMIINNAIERPRALHWYLTGTLGAGQVRTFRRNGQAMTLNNAGDEIKLFNAAPAERDRFSICRLSKTTW